MDKSLQKKGSKGITVLVIALMFAGLFIANYGQYQLAAVPSMVFAKFGLTNSQFSSLMTAPMIPAIFFSIIAGVLADKFGINKIVLAGLFLTAVGYILRTFATSFTMMFIGMVLSGFAATVLTVNLAKIVSCFFPVEKIGKIIGIIMVGSTAAMTVAYATTSLFSSLSSAFLLTAVISTVIFLVWLFFIRDKHFSAGQGQAGPEPVSISESLKVSVKSSKVWFMGLALATLLGGAMVVTNFQVAALTSLKGYSELYAGTFGTVLTIGAILGTVLFPMLIGNVKKPSYVLLISALIAAVSTFGIVALPAMGIYVSSFLNGFFRSGIITIMMSYPVMFKEIGPKYAGTAAGVAVTLELAGAVILPTYVIIPLGGGSMISYFVLGMVSMAIAAVFSFIISKGIEKDSKTAG